MAGVTEDFLAALDASGAAHEKPLAACDAAEAAQDHIYMCCMFVSRTQAVSTAHTLKIQRCRPLQLPHGPHACGDACMKLLLAGRYTWHKPGPGLRHASSFPKQDLSAYRRCALRGLQAYKL